MRVALDDDAATTFTDDTGGWHIDNVPEGAHSITFTKSGFGAVHVASQFVFAPNTMTPDVIMTLTPTQQAIIDSISVETVMNPTGPAQLYLVRGHLSFPPPDNANAVSVVTFLGKTADVSADTSSFERSAIFNHTAGKVSSFLTLFSADEIQKAFGSGTRAFATAYVTGAGCTCTPDPTEPSASKPVFSGTGPRGNVVELTIP